MFRADLHIFEIQMFFFPFLAPHPFACECGFFEGRKSSKFSFAFVAVCAPLSREGTSFLPYPTDEKI